MNETEALIENRKSCRAFSDKPVTEETLNRLKHLTLRAPSGGNMIMYSIIEVRDEAKKLELSKICDSQPMIAKAPLVWVFLADDTKWLEYFSLGECDKKANTPIRRVGLGDLHLSMQDAIIAGQNAAMAAEALGLGSCYIGDVIENYEKLQALLELPAHAVPACMLIMGYPKESLKDRALTKRPPIDSSVFMTDSYKKHTLDSLSYQYSDMEAEMKKNKVIEHDKLYADRYYTRKFNSDFMAEMNRSTKVFVERWLNEEEF
jgi:Nitroreductase